MTDKVQKIREEVEKRYEYWKEKESNSHSIESEIRMSECQHLLLMLNSLQGEPTIPDIVDEHYWEMLGEEPQEHVSDDFEKALTEMIGNAQKCVVEPWAVAAQWKDYLIELAKSEGPAMQSYITPNQKFFQWIYDRLIYVHNENPNVDYMLSLKERIKDM